MRNRPVLVQLRIWKLGSDVLQEHDQAVDPNLVTLADAYEKAVAHLGSEPALPAGTAICATQNVPCVLQNPPCQGRQGKVGNPCSVGPGSRPIILPFRS